MTTTFAVQEKLMPASHTTTMRAAVFHGVDDIRVEDGYAIILDNAPGAGNIVSADKNLDITDRVVSRLRATPAAKIAAPATKPGAPAAPAGVGKPPIKPPTE